MRHIHQVINSLKRGLEPCLVSDLEQGEGRGTQEGRRISAFFSNLYLYESEGVVCENCWGGHSSLSLYLCGCCYILQCSVSIHDYYLQYFTWYSIYQQCRQLSKISSLSHGFVSPYLYGVLQLAMGYHKQLNCNSNLQRRRVVQAKGYPVFALYLTVCQRQAVDGDIPISPS